MTPSNSNSNLFRIYGTQENDATSALEGQSTDITPISDSDEERFEAGFPVPQNDIAPDVANDEQAQTLSEEYVEEVTPDPSDPLDYAHEDETKTGPEAEDVFTSLHPKQLMPPPLTAVSVIAAILLLAFLTTLVLLYSRCAFSLYSMRGMHYIGQIVTGDQGVANTEAKSGDRA